MSTNEKLKDITAVSKDDYSSGTAANKPRYNSIRTRRGVKWLKKVREFRKMMKAISNAKMAKARALELYGEEVANKIVIPEIDMELAALVMPVRFSKSRTTKEDKGSVAPPKVAEEESPAAPQNGSSSPANGGSQPSAEAGATVSHSSEPSASGREGAESSSTTSNPTESEGGSDSASASR